MKKTDNIYTIINNSIDISYLIDLFYEQINTKEPLESLPICIKIVNRIKSLKKEYTDEEELVFLELNNLYVFSMSQINRIIYHLKYETETDLSTKEIDNKLYLGFGIISKKENQDQDVKDYVARKMIKDMFNDTFPNHKFNIEEELHTRFNSKNKVVENGINKSIIDIISSHDPYLSDYISCHTDILNDVKNKFIDMVNNYDMFEEKNEENRYKFLIEDVTDFCNDKGMNVDENLFKIAAEYIILDKVIKYSKNYDSSDYNTIKELIISASRDEIDFNYVQLRKIVKNYLDTRFITNKLSDSSDSLQVALDEYLTNVDNMNEDESLKKAEEILKEVKTNEEFDYAIEYLINNKKIKDKQILRFIKKRDI